MTVTTGARVTTIGRIDVLGFDLQHLLFEGLHLDVGAELARDHRCGLVVERAVDRHHQPAIHQLLEDVLRLDVELGGEIGDSHAFGERNRPRDGRRRRLARLPAHGLAATLIAPLPPAAGCPADRVHAADDKPGMPGPRRHCTDERAATAAAAARPSGPGRGGRPPPGRCGGRASRPAPGAPGRAPRGPAQVACRRL